MNISVSWRLADGLAHPARQPLPRLFLFLLAALHIAQAEAITADIALSAGRNLIAYANSAAIVQAGGNVSIVAGSQTNTGTIQGSSVYLGGGLTNGPTSYNQPTPNTTLRETGQATFIAGLAYDETTGLGVDSQQRALLYEAAARFATANGIQLGVALSAEQQKALTEPILWYVTESVTGPDGIAYSVLAPRLYLPEGQLTQLANVAGGIIRGNDVVLDAGEGTIRNTGYVVADTLTVKAGQLINEKRSAAWGSYTENVKGGYVEVWGDTVQPGGFISAAKLDLRVSSIKSISGEFYRNGTEVSGQLKQAMGSGFAQSQNIDHTFTKFHEDNGGRGYRRDSWRDSVRNPRTMSQLKRA